MHQHRYVERVVDLMDPGENVLLNMSYQDAAERVASGAVLPIREGKCLPGVLAPTYSRSVGRHISGEPGR